MEFGLELLPATFGDPGAAANFLGHRDWRQHTLHGQLLLFLFSLRRLLPFRGFGCMRRRHPCAGSKFHAAQCAGQSCTYILHPHTAKNRPAWLPLPAIVSRCSDCDSETLAKTQSIAYGIEAAPAYLWRAVMQYAVISVSLTSCLGVLF